MVGDNPWNPNNMSDAGFGRGMGAGGRLDLGRTSDSRSFRQKVDDLNRTNHPNQYKNCPPTQKQALPPSKIHKHHIYPQAHRDWFAKRGIDIDKHTIPLERGTHLGGTHGKGGFVGPGNKKLPGKWNKQWNDFIKNNPNATSKDIYQQGGRMMDDFGFNKLPIGPYK